MLSIAAWESVFILRLVESDTARIAVQIAASSGRVDDGQFSILPLTSVRGYLVVHQPNPVIFILFINLL